MKRYLNILGHLSILRDYYMTFSISAQVLARDSHIKPDSEAGGLIWVEGWYQGWYGKFDVNLFVTYFTLIFSKHWWGPGRLGELGLHELLGNPTTYHQYGFVNYKKGALDSQPQVIKFTSCLPMVGGSLRLLPPLKLVTMI